MKIKKLSMIMCLVFAFVLPLILVGCGKTLKEEDVIGKYEMTEVSISGNGMTMKKTRQEFETLDQSDETYEMYSSYFAMSYEFKTNGELTLYMGETVSTSSTYSWNINGDKINIVSEFNGDQMTSTATLSNNTIIMTTDMMGTKIVYTLTKVNQ